MRFKVIVFVQVDLFVIPRDETVLTNPWLHTRQMGVLMRIHIYNSPPTDGKPYAYQIKFSQKQHHRLIVQLTDAFEGIIGLHY